MANFDSGVASYITATGKVSNHFPVDNKGNAFVCCTYCKYWSKFHNSCDLTDEIIVMPDKFVGYHCPLKEMEVE